MSMNEWLTVTGIFLGPVIAVIITLWIEGRRRRRDGRTIVLRQLMITRHLPGDPSYSAAVNLVPVEFNDSAEVIAAYKAYQEAIRAVPSDNPDANLQAGQLVVAKQTKMIYAIMRSLGLKVSEADLPIEAYAARGMIERDALYLRSLEGTVRIANALEAQVAMLEAPSHAANP